MKYRQWKKNYKKKHGVNPPLWLDRKKRRRYIRKRVRRIAASLEVNVEIIIKGLEASVMAIKKRLIELQESMNNVSLTGRLTREPELRYGGQDNSTAITRFTLAVDDGKDTDFINIKCFGRIAEWVQKWLSKGSRAEVTGKIKTGSYESQRTGGKVYYTEVVANSVGFGESKAEAEARGQQLPESDGFMNIPEGADEELPFN